MPDSNSLALSTWVDWDTSLSNRPQIICGLEGGLSHRSFLASGYTNDGQELYFVLRHYNQASSNLASPAEVELRVIQLAGSLAPRVVFRNNDVLITEYVDLPLWQPPEFISRIGASMRLLHSIACPADLPQLDLQQHCESYRGRLGDLGEHQRLYDSALQHLLAARPKYPEAVLCHNDPNPGNILIDADDFCLIDWEYACVNSPWFDLASVAEYGNLNRQQTALLSHGYCEGVDADRCLRAIETFRPMVRLVEWLWLLLQASDQAPKSQRRLQQLLDEKN